MKTKFVSIKLVYKKIHFPKVTTISQSAYYIPIFKLNLCRVLYRLNNI